MKYQEIRTTQDQFEAEIAKKNKNNPASVESYWTGSYLKKNSVYLVLITPSLIT